MIEIRKIENDFINKLTVATVDIYEVLSGIQRLRDTVCNPARRSIRHLR